MSVAGSAKRLLAPAAKTLAPRLFWRRKYRILQRLGESRPDVVLVRSLCDPGRVSLDIGADVGEFAIAMLTSSRSVIAFEPRPAQARDLTAMFDTVGAPVRVEAVALSDTPGRHRDAGSEVRSGAQHHRPRKRPRHRGRRSRPDHRRRGEATRRPAIWTTSGWSKSTWRAMSWPSFVAPWTRLSATTRRSS